MIMIIVCMQFVLTMLIAVKLNLVINVHVILVSKAMGSIFVMILMNVLLLTGNGDRNLDYIDVGESP